MKEKHAALASQLKAFVSASYPNMDIVVSELEEDPSRLALFFTEERFSVLYPLQRYHYLVHLIPADFVEAHLAGAIWHELAPGETPDDLRYPDPELIEDISQDVLNVLGRSGFFALLDKLFLPEESTCKPGRCHGDFRHSKKILEQLTFSAEDQFDVLHVLMARGGYCDCEILYNAAPESRLRAAYWTARAEGKEPPNPHAGV